MVRHRIAACLSMALATSAAACDPDAFGPSPTASNTGPEPTASVALAPLATAIPGDAGTRPSTDSGLDLGTDAAPPPPKPYRPDDRVEVERAIAPELSGVGLQAWWRWRDVPTPAKAPHADEDALGKLATQAELRWEIWLTTTGRMRVRFASPTQPLPMGSELLARQERYGHLLLWPNRRRLRVLVPGVMRSVLSEQRADVSPLVRGELEELGNGERLELRTRRLAVTSSYGRLELELAPSLEAGLGAPLLCRLLVEMVGVSPSSEACQPGEVVVAADFRWNPVEEKVGPGLRLEVTKITPHGDLPSNRFLMAPSGTKRTASGLPGERKRMFFDEEALRTLRTEAAAPPDPPDPRAPEAGLRANNRSDALMILLVDGLPVASLPPWSQMDLTGLKNGRYSVQYRSFLGARVGDVSEVDLPARVLFGEMPEEETKDAG